MQQIDFALKGNQMTWIGQIGSLESAMTPPPDWLAARPQLELRLVDASRRYALFRPADVLGPPPCSANVEVLTSAGKAAAR